MRLCCPGVTRGLRNLTTLYKSRTRQLPALIYSCNLNRTVASQAVAVNKFKQSIETGSSNFYSLGLGEDLVAALAQQRLHTPTEIQSSAIPQILEGGDLLLASQTGSGKTLAYLLPLVKLLKAEEKKHGVVSRPKRPRAIVLGPTRELTDQILAVAKSISHNAKFRSGCVNGGGSLGQQAKLLATPLDILIGTPQKISQHAAAGNVFYGDVQYVVLDEADTMFDKGFGPEVKAILGPVRNKEEPASCLLVLATLRQDIQKLIVKEFPDMRHVKTSSLHKGVSTAKHVFLDIPGTDNKLHHLDQVLSIDTSRRRRIMVFCNTLDSCRATDYYLRDKGFNTVCYHGDVPFDGRRDAIRQFLAPEHPTQQPVLVCTDLAARGLDLTGGVDHVVNFDFPLNPIDYIHRSGRTARAGEKGKITSLIVKRDKVLAARIDDAIRHGRALDELSADRSILPPNMRPKPETLKRQELERKAEQHSRRGVRGTARMQSSSNTKAPAKQKPAGKSGSGSRTKSATASKSTAPLNQSSGVTKRTSLGRNRLNGKSGSEGVKRSGIGPRRSRSEGDVTERRRVSKPIRMKSFKH